MLQGMEMDGKDFEADIKPLVDAAIDNGSWLLLAGHEIAFTPEAVVLHSHERGVRYELDRTVKLHKRLGELFGLRTIPGLTDLFHAWSSTLADHWDCLRNGEGPRPDTGEVVRALSLAVMWPLGQYLGGRHAAERVSK